MVRLLELAQTLDTASQTRSKLVKQKVLAAFFDKLREQDLRLAVRYADGKAFASTDERVLGISSAIIREIVLELLRVAAAHFREVTIRQGDMGEAIAELWPSAGGNDPDSDSTALTLNDLSAAFDQIATTSQAATKKPILYNLFARCTDPREACYLAKIVLADMRTGVKQGLLQAAIAEAYGYLLDDITGAQLLVGDLDEVAVLASQKRVHDARFTLFHPLQFMLASPIQTADEAPGDWIVEDKLDGIRAQAHVQKGKVAIYTRTMDRTDDSFPDVVRQLQVIRGEFLIDGEIVPWREARALPFAVLQKRLGRKRVTAAHLAEAPAILIAFDLLYLNGQLLLDEPLRVRQSLLRTLAADNPGLIVLPSSVAHQTGDVDIAFAKAREAGNEGLILKSPDSVYAPGRRGGQWLKLKTHLPTLDCVVTAAEYGHGKRRGVLSDYTFAVWSHDQLLNIGKAYSGVTDAEIADLTATFMSISTSDNGRVFQVPPKVVLEIAFDQITESSRHASGYAMRFPRIKRIRHDKSPADADTIHRVREIYQSPSNLGKKLDVISTKAEPGLFDSL